MELLLACGVWTFIIIWDIDFPFNYPKHSSSKEPAMIYTPLKNSAVKSTTESWSKVRFLERETRMHFKFHQLEAFLNLFNNIITSEQMPSIVQQLMLVRVAQELIGTRYNLKPLNRSTTISNKCIVAKHFLWWRPPRLLSITNSKE